MIDIKGYSLKNSLNEFTIDEFEKVTAILNRQDLESIEKYIEALLYLGLPEEILDELSDDEFFGIIKAFTFTEELGELKARIEIEGYHYVAYEGEAFVLKVKDLSLIEKAVIQKPEAYLSRALAIIFKRDDLTRVEHYAESHIQEKTKLFKKLNASLAYPYLIHITQKLKQKIESAEATA
jgi:hypothetical protein